MKKGFLFFVLLFVGLQLSAQRQNFWVKGVVRDSTELIANAHVVNLTTEKGTFTSDYGLYRMVVALGDTIQVTSVQYETVTKVITEPIAFSKKLSFVLKKKVVELDEIEIKRHDLTGILESDRKKVSKDSIAAKGKSISAVIMELSEKDMQGEAKVKNVMDKGTAAISSRNTDPTRKLKGVGTAFSLGGRDKKAEKIKQITSDKFTSKVIYDTYGKEFFVDDLKIPEKEIFNFIDYCKQHNIKNLHNKGLGLQVAVILEREAPKYLRTLK